MGHGSAEPTRTIAQLGFWSGMIAATAALAYDVVQLLQVSGVLTFPLDGILIYGTSLCIVVPLVLEMLSFHHSSDGDQRFWSHAALVFTIIYAVFVTANYVVQLATVIPAKTRGTSQALGILDQTPHSLFWDYDAVGYISMGLATLLAVPAVEKAGVGIWVRRALVANAAVTVLISVVYFYPTFTPKLLFLGFPWAITAPLFMLLLAILLRQRSPRSLPD